MNREFQPARSPIDVRVDHGCRARRGGAPRQDDAALHHRHVAGSGCGQEPEGRNQIARVSTHHRIGRGTVVPEAAGVISYLHGDLASMASGSLAGGGVCSNALSSHARTAASMSATRTPGHHRKVPSQLRGTMIEILVPHDAGEENGDRDGRARSDPPWRHPV